jgi:hypothetical protein
LLSIRLNWISVPIFVRQPLMLTILSPVFICALLVASVRELRHRRRRERALAAVTSIRMIINPTSTFMKRARHEHYGPLPARFAAGVGALVARSRSSSPSIAQKPPIGSALQRKKRLPFVEAGYLGAHADARTRLP